MACSESFIVSVEIRPAYRELLQALAVVAPSQRPARLLHLASLGLKAQRATSPEPPHAPHDDDVDELLSRLGL